MATRILYRDNALQLRSIEEHDGRWFVLNYDNTLLDSERALHFLKEHIPRGWRLAHNRDAQFQIGRIKYPLARNVRQLGR